MIRWYLRFVNAVAERRTHETPLRVLLYALPVATLSVVIVVSWQFGWITEVALVILLMFIAILAVHSRDSVRTLQLFTRQDVYEDETLFLDEQGIPLPYDHLPHIKRFWKRALPGLLLIVLAQASLAIAALSITDGYATVGLVLLCLILVLAGLYLIGREYHRYKQEPIHCEPEDGLVSIFQANSLPWLLRGSDPDPYSVDEFVLFTPQKTIWEWLIFHGSQTLQIKAGPQADATILMEVRDVRYVKHLIAIQKYRQALQAQEVEHAKTTVELQEVLVDQGRVITALLIEHFQRIGGDTDSLQDTYQRLGGRPEQLMNVLRAYDEDTQTQLPDTP